MPLLATSELAQTLHGTNVRLCFWLDSLTDNPARPGTPQLAASPQQMAGLLSELMRAGHWLRALPAHKDAALDEQLGEYRRNVERLHSMLPSIHETLIRERARLEQERARVESAATWASGSRQTL